MQIKRTEAVKLAVASGFTKAGEWDDTKLSGWLKKAVDKLDENDVPSEHAATFGLLQDAIKNNSPIEIVSGEAKTEAKKSDVKPSPEKKPAAKGAAKTEAVKAGPVKKDNGKPVGKDKPEPKKPAAKKEKVAAVAKVAKQKDAFGSEHGTVRASINAAVDSKWRTHEELAEKAGTKERPTKLQLRRLLHAHPKMFEKRKRIEYRLKEAANK